MTTASRYIQDGNPFLRFQMPRRMKSLIFESPAHMRYLGAWGGRASGKSRGFCMGLLAKGMERRRRIVCGREYLNSLRESSHAELCYLIDALDLHRWYEYGESYIVNKRNGTEFLYMGLRYAINSVTSISNVDLFFADEAEAISDRSWRKLGPSIRAPGSQIWLAWNPEDADSATHKRFRVNPSLASRMVRMNWRDNPWFSAEMEVERQHDLAIDQDMYNHIWEGECISRSDAKVYNGKWEARAFTPGPDWDGPYYGLDFGFSVDPTAGVKLWIYKNCIYVEHEAGRRYLEINDTPDYLIGRLPGVERHVLRCDDARPESISYLSKHGIPKAQRSEGKYAGCVEDGISVIRSFDKIVIHPRCTETIREMGKYMYKVNKLGDVTTDIIDANNHYCDAMRYALTPLIRVLKKKLNIVLEEG